MRNEPKKKGKTKESTQQCETTRFQKSKILYKNLKKDLQKLNVSWGLNLKKGVIE
jgi:hypothetical protein